MKLSQLIQQANDIYRLSLTASEKHELQRRLASAGFESDVGRQTPEVLDAVLQTADNLRQRPRLATATTQAYSAMKVEAAAEHDGCPRCRQSMCRVVLIGERQADYCQACAITLPTKA